MKDRSLFLLAILLALVFAFMGIIWIYYIALFIGYPSGLASLLIWRGLSKRNFKGHKIIPWILLAGLVASLSVLGHYLIRIYMPGVM